MQVANCQVFSLLGLVGLLMFFTSFLTIDFHMSNEHPSVHRGHEFFHSPRKEGYRVYFKSGPMLSVLQGLKQTFSNNGTTMAIGETKKKKENGLPKNTELSSLKAAEPYCKVTFQPTCRINPLVKYWDEVMECYTSPLRDLTGLKAPLEDRKYVVFQADSGGWNNIRMALEVVILFAQVTGRILVLPPNAVLYLLHLNKKWKDNKSSMEDYFDFDKLRAARGLETTTMSEFLGSVARNGLLNIPLPNNDTELVRQPLWEYLNSACFVREWSPGKLFIGFNITSVMDGHTTPSHTNQDSLVGSFESTDPARIEEFSLKKKRTLLPYDPSMHHHRAIYFPGSEPNRLLTHFYSMLFFATPREEHRAKRYMRDRLRYHDQIFCTGSEIIEKLLQLEALLAAHVASVTTIKTASNSNNNNMNADAEVNSYSYNDNNNNNNNNHTSSSDTYTVDPTVAARILDIVEFPLQHPPNAEIVENSEKKKNNVNVEETEDLRSGRILPTYVAFHIRRGDFQQKHTRLPAEQIVALTNHLVPDRHTKVAYISTDEGNRSFFEPFVREYGAVYFLGDLKNGTDVDEINQNYVGMIEQVVCANADVFIGTPLSTFTAYITRMRGFMNRTITHLPRSMPPPPPPTHTHTPITTGVTRQSAPLDGNTPAQLTHKYSMNSVRAPAAVADRGGLYKRTYYFMNHHMYMLHEKPHVHFPLWIRDFVEAFEDIDDDF